VGGGGGGGGEDPFKMFTACRGTFWIPNKPAKKRITTLLSLERRYSGVQILRKRAKNASFATLGVILSPLT